VLLLHEDSAYTCVASISFKDKGLGEIREGQNWCTDHGLLKEVKGMLMLWSPREQNSLFEKMC
jgi:hypothetical protein